MACDAAYATPRRVNNVCVHQIVYLIKTAPWKRSQQRHVSPRLWRPISYNYKVTTTCAPRVPGMVLCV